jgi:hypothetical protein
MPKRDSIASNSYKYGSISVKYRFFLVFSRFPPVFRFFSKSKIEYFGFQKTSFFFGLPKNAGKQAAETQNFLRVFATDPKLGLGRATS